MENIAKIESVIKPIVEGLGYELVAVKYSTPHGVETVSVIIYKKGDMGHVDCEAVHNAIDAPLDKLNPSADKPYTLEVSSMGLDWKIVTDDDFRRRIDEEIDVSLYAKIDGKKKFSGVLKTYDAESFTIEECVMGVKKNRTFFRKDAAKIVPTVHFN
jgi:Uncharacterized protein conserved in bacteria